MKKVFNFFERIPSLLLVSSIVLFYFFWYGALPTIMRTNHYAFLVENGIYVDDRSFLIPSIDDLKFIINNHLSYSFIGLSILILPLFLLARKWYRKNAMNMFIFFVILGYSWICLVLTPEILKMDEGYGINFHLDLLPNVEALKFMSRQHTLMLSIMVFGEFSFIAMFINNIKKSDFIIHDD